MSSLVTTVLAAALVNNLVFVHLVGISSLLFHSQRLKNSIEFSFLAAVQVFLSTTFNLLLYRWVLSPLELELINLVVFISISAAVGIGLVKLIDWKLPLTAHRQRIAVSLLSVSSAIVGAALINTTSLLSTIELVTFCFGTALGFALTLVAFAALRQRIDHDGIPATFRGAPLELISAGIIAMAFLGFAGLV